MYWVYLTQNWTGVMMYWTGVSVFLEAGLIWHIHLQTPEQIFPWSQDEMQHGHIEVSITEVSDNPA